MSHPTDPLLEPTPSLARTQGAPAQTLPVKICFFILFNHRFEANLPKLDQIYGGRFEHLRYLVPFYRGERADVFAVYYSSFQFQGYFMEAWRRLRGEGFTHFVFCADDMVLNPRLNGENFCAELGLDEHTGYIKEINPLTTTTLGWGAMASGLVAVAGKNGVNWEKELPSADRASANLEAKGFRFGRLGWRNLRGARAKGVGQSLFYLAHRLNLRRRHPDIDVLGLPYPLLHGLSDLLCVPAAYMEKFTFYCSVFAAMGVFVEIAVPTALALSCPRLVREQDTGWAAKDYWQQGPAFLEAFCQKYDYRLDRLLDSFEERTLCIHPIKFSLWK